MIFRVDPENGDRGHLVLFGDPFGQFERRNRLEQGENRPAEQTRLLTGQYRHCLGIDELLGLVTCQGRRAASVLLGREHGGNLATLPGVTLRGGDGARPRRSVSGVAGKKRRDGVEVEGVICREPPDPGKAAEIHRNPCRRILARGETVFS